MKKRQKNFCSWRREREGGGGEVRQNNDSRRRIERNAHTDTETDREANSQTKKIGDTDRLSF